MSIFELLGFKTSERVRQADPGETAAVRKIVDELDHLDPDRARFVAAFAYVLSRVAHADLSISEAETRAMERIVVEQTGLPEEQAIIVVQIAKSQNILFGGTENYLVTREFHRVATRDEKLGLLRCLFHISAADLSISSTEDGVIRQIAEELLLEHADFIAVRAEFREHLAVLKKPPVPEGGS